MKKSFEELNNDFENLFLKMPEIPLADYYHAKNQDMIGHITDRIFKSEIRSIEYRHCGNVPKEDFVINTAIKTSLRKFCNFYPFSKEGCAYATIYSIYENLDENMGNAFEVINGLRPIINSNRKDRKIQKELSVFLEDIVAMEFLLDYLPKRDQNGIRTKLIESNETVRNLLMEGFPFRRFISELETTPNPYLDDCVAHSRKSYLFLFLTIYLYEYVKKMENDSYETIFFEEFSLDEFDRRVNTFLELNMMQKLSVRTLDHSVCRVVRDMYYESPFDTCSEKT